MEVRRLRRGDGDRLRAVRLRALADAPYAFSSSLKRELDLGPRFWEERVAESELGERGAVFAALDDDRSVGMAGGFFPDDDHEIAMLWGMWVDPLARRRGLGHELVEAVAGWAADVGAGQLRLAVTECEEAQPAGSALSQARVRRYWAAGAVGMEPITHHAGPVSLTLSDSRQPDKESVPMRQLHTSARLHSGVPYHYAASATGVGLVFTAGACPLDEDGRVVAPGDVAAQTRQALTNLQIALEDAGCQPANLLKTTVFVASSSRDDLLAAWTEYAAVYGTDGPPSTLLGVSMLGWPDQLVEIEAVAFRD